MEEHLLTHGAGRNRPGRQGFTLIEVMTAMAISLVVLLANLTVLMFAQRNFAESRSLTDATNLATGKMSDFKTMTVAQITAQNPKNDSPVVNGIQFTRAWTVSNVDANADGLSEMVGDIVKIRLSVTWRINKRDHQVVMTTLTTGKPA